MKVNKIPEDIRDYLRYENGKLFWTKKPCKKVIVGDEAGSINKNTGYKEVGFKGKLYLAHRVVWFLVKNEQPPEILDHINNDKSDNHIENLREATSSQNNSNAKIRKDNTSGVKGVTWYKQGNKWQASLRLNNKRIHLGSFTDLADAEQAVKQARHQLHGEFANHG